MYENVCDLYIPKRSNNNVRIDSPRWMKTEIKHMIREKHKIWHYNNRRNWKNIERNTKFKVLKLKIKKR
jgi:predicted nucleotidyltransferase